MTRLAHILASKRAELAALRRRSASRASAFEPRGDRVARRLRRADEAPLGLLAEIKHKSPSVGPLSTQITPGERAIAYARGGAAMISVLCDGPFFGGSYGDLEEVRGALAQAGDDALVLAKEFVIDEAQIDAVRAAGADAVLLIARIVDAPTLERLVAKTRDVQLEPLVEVVTDAELAAALTAGATFIGVNARDLDTLEMDRERAARVLAAIPPPCVAVHLSGLKGPDDIREVARSRADAALVGEALMRKDDPRELLASMMVASRTPRKPDSGAAAP